MKREVKLIFKCLAGTKAFVLGSCTLLLFVPTVTVSKQRDSGAGTVSRGCCGSRTPPGYAKRKKKPTRVLSRGSMRCESRWPHHSRLLPMQFATFEINLPPPTFCIMQRMPPFLGFATPHPSPETNHCRARASAQRPRPLPGPHAVTTTAATATKQHGAAPATGPPPLKGRWPLLKGPSRARRAGARRPGSRRAAPSLGRARSTRRPSAGPCRRHREQHFYSGDA